MAESRGYHQKSNHERQMRLTTMANLITVFTPTYNRGGFLYDIFESLSQQTFKDFEWIIVDDGSTDNTKDMMDKIIADYHSFPIRYIYKKNGGKHTAINRGVKEAKGELFLILDSDDELPNNSLQDIWKEYKTIHFDNSFAGVAGRMAHRNGTMIGGGYNFSIIDATSIEMKYNYGLKGDACEVFRTDILKKYPFPEITEEKFVPEDLILNRISKQYKLRWFNKVIYYRDYLDGGLTDNIIKIRMKSPKAATLYYFELYKNKISYFQKIKGVINYIRFSYCIKSTPIIIEENHKELIKYPIPKISFYWKILYPIGFMMHLKDRFTV